MALSQFRKPWLRIGSDRMGIWCVLALTCLLWPTRIDAQQLTSGTSSRSAKEEAEASLPLQELTAESQAKINGVLENTSFYRRLPVNSIEIDPEYFLLLARYPEIVVETWRLMGVTQMTTERTGPYSLHSNDGAGTISDIELIYGNQGYHLYYGVGSYEGPLNRRPLTGQCVIIMRTEYGRAPNGNPTAINVLDIFLKVDNAAAGFITRTLNPIVGKTADHNFTESLNFIQRLNETTEKNGPGVQAMAYRLSGLHSDVRQMLVEVAGNVFERKQLRSGVITAGASLPSSYPIAPPAASPVYSAEQAPR